MALADPIILVGATLTLLNAIIRISSRSISPMACQSMAGHTEVELADVI